MTTIEWDKPNTFINLVDRAVSKSASKGKIKAFLQRDDIYLDDTARSLEDILDVADLFCAINEQIRDSMFWIHHGTRLSNQDYVDVNKSGLIPLENTNRIKMLRERIIHYAKKHAIHFDETRFLDLVEEHRSRDHKAIFFSVSQSFQIHECPEYLHFGSEFEVVIVVWLLGRYHRHLLKEDTKAAFVSWRIDATYVLEAKCENDVYELLDRGNYPSMESHMLDAWRVWKRGETDLLSSLRPDYSVTLRAPFPPLKQKVSWVAENQLKRFDP